MLGFGVVIAATLVPTGAALAGEASDGVCGTSRIGMAPLEDLLVVSSTSLNVLLFVPLGIAVGLLPANRKAGIIIIGAVSLTFVVETLQLLVTPLGRNCETADLVDNLMGLAVGTILGLIARVALAMWSRPDRLA